MVHCALISDLDSESKMRIRSLLMSFGFTTRRDELMSIDEVKFFWENSVVKIQSFSRTIVVSREVKPSVCFTTFD